MSAAPTFLKMSGAGNDFVVLHADEARRLAGGWPRWVRRICRRGLSVGADGVLVVESAGARRVRVRFYNPDGGEAFCGNGSRCAARFARLEGLVTEDSFVLETPAGSLSARLDADRVTLDLPAPIDRGELRLELGPGALRGRHVVAGVPHLVVWVDDVDGFDLACWAAPARRHEQFGEEGTNVDVVEHEQGGARLRIRTWERGVEGETLSCGSGAVAAAYAARLGGAPQELRVVPASGVELHVEIPDPVERPALARLTGDARIVFAGRLHAEATGFD